MTDKIEDQDIIGDLHGDENNVEEAHDPKDAELKAVAAADKAEDAAPKAKARKGDKSNKEPMHKVDAKGDPSAKIRDAGAQPTEGVRLTKASMINDAYNKMSTMTKEDLAILMAKIDSTDENEAIEESEQSTIDYQGNWENDLNALVNDEATLSEEFRSKAETIFNTAIKSKLSEEIDRLEEKYESELEASVEETKAGLVDKVDSYLNYVVENWMAENQVAVQSGLRTEIAEKFMNNLKDLFTESYIDVPESKVDLVDDLAAEVEELEDTLNGQTARTIEMQEELEGYKREAVLREASKDLAETQIDKLRSLIENEDFDTEETFAKKVATIKESYFNKKTTDTTADVDIDEEASDEVESTGSMSQYVSALKTQTKNT